MQNAIFWLSGLLFFVVQLRFLGVLLRRGGANEATRHVEIVWTLIPASLIAALALMLGGLTTTAWTRPEPSDEPLAVRLVLPTPSDGAVQPTGATFVPTLSSDR